MRDIWKALTILALVLFVSGIASAATLQFTAKDPADVSKADFDILKFGAKDNGNTIDFWIEVRGKINTEPENGYLNAYAIDIEGIQIVGMWYNIEGTKMGMVYVTTDSGTSTLSPSEYKISGNRIDFYLDKALFQNIGSDYTVTVYTAHIESTSASSVSYNEDDATYSSYSSGGSSSSSSSGGSGGFPYWIILAVIIVVGVIVALVILMKKQKEQYQTNYYNAPPPGNGPPPPPPQPPMPPSEQNQQPYEQSGNQEEQNY